MATKTDIQESAQALFCALGDYVGSSKIDNVLNISMFEDYSIFKEFWTISYPSQSLETIYKQRVNSPGVSFSAVETFITKDKSWYASSVQIAKKIIEEVQSINQRFSKIKNSGWQDIVYVRGDIDVMQNIEKLFKLAQANEKEINKIPGAGKSVLLSDVNKWSPADIYFASTTAKNKISHVLREQNNPNIKMNYNILNSLVSDLIDSGDLLPLSLKKQPKDVILQKVNFNRKDELAHILQFSFYKLDWQPYKKSVARTFVIRMNPKNDKHRLNIRHDNSSNVFKGEIDFGGGSRGGSSSKGPLIAVIATIDSVFASKLSREIDKQQKIFVEEKKKIIPLKTTNRKAYDELNDKFSGESMNSVFQLMADWLNSNKKRADTFVQQYYMYVSSRSENSGKFVIAK